MNSSDIQAYKEIVSRTKKFKKDPDAELMGTVGTLMDRARTTVAEFFILDSCILSSEVASEAVQQINDQLETMAHEELGMSVKDLFAPLWKYAQIVTRGGHL